MNTYKVAGLVIGAAIMLSPFVVSAATISNPLFSNGDTTISATGGSTVSGTFALTVGTNEVCEIIRTQSDPSQAPTDASVGGQLGYQEGYYPNVPFTVKAPPNTSTVWPTVQCAGIYGGIRSVDGADNVVVGPQSLGTLRVVSTGGGYTSTSGATIDPAVQAQLDAFTAKIDALIAAMTKLGSTGSTGTNCPVPAYTGDNAYEVQGWLMAHGQAGPFNTIGVYSPTGTWGNASKTAYKAAVNACK